jgi:hypothetical protein
MGHRTRLLDVSFCRISVSHHLLLPFAFAGRIVFLSVLRLESHAPLLSMADDPRLICFRSGFQIFSAHTGEHHSMPDLPDPAQGVLVSIDSFERQQSFTTL